ncbi:F0F1 ATP synthase subunit B [Sediminibacterium soli]|uniref:F0F1 ATP synthase subunit B n=1 Tax=Sediminibacterium soli TaxID=2698829 RepID=UPI00137A8566|nr:F0F1 ATP synthase subunit B [Sediminibacterium soli]NCI45478.1 F0F1 ATP synthase subunit B [Sediminibacterium soli]
MLLEINPLVLPDIGLVFWATVAFLILLIVLGKFAWKPIMNAIREREQGIEDALARADKMKAEMAAMQNENEQLMAQAREERATMIKEAKEQTLKMISDAKDKAKAEYDRIVTEAQATIAQQTNAALTEVKNQVGGLVIEVSEKILRRELANKAEQEKYINELAEGVKLN